MKQIKRIVSVFVASIATLGFAFALPVAAASSTLVVTPTNPQGWAFNPDPANSTPYNFSEDQAKTGEGSLYVQPISATPAQKFIAAQELDTLVSDFKSVSYDFLIAGDGTPDDADQFYLNVYTLLPNTSETYFSCRYDYVPTTGSTTEFTSVTFNASDAPTLVQNRNGSECPATLDQMEPGSTVSFITLNTGDTSANDEGLAGYFDNVIISSGEDITTYNFELNEPVTQPKAPTNKEECKKDGWRVAAENRQFKNQGDCVSYFQSNGRSNENPVVSFFKSIFNR